MKVTSFHFMPYRELPDDVDQRYPSVWVDAPWWELGDAEKVGDYYNQSIDELMLAAKLGFDGARHERAPSEPVRVHVQPEPVRGDPRAADARPAA